MLLSCMLLTAPDLSAQHKSDTLRIYFRLGSAALDMNYRQNAERCEEFIRNVKEIQESYKNEKIVDVDFHASASPEGPFKLNERLAQKRMEAITTYLRKKLQLDSSVVSITSISENWNGLRSMIEKDPQVPGRDEALSIMTSGDDDEREKQLRKVNGGETWKYITKNFFPNLRVVRLLVHTQIRHPYVEFDRPAPVTDKPLHATTLQRLPVAPAVPAETQSLQRLTIKTNALGWSIMGMNFGIEYDFAPHFSVAVPFYYSGGLDYFKETIKFRGIVLQPEVRWWPVLQGGKNGGFYVGAHLGLGWYNFALNGDWRIQDHKGNRPSWGGGIGLGYKLRFAKRPGWGMEFALGAGVYDSKYDMFYNEGNGPYFDKAIRKTWFGIDNAAVSFFYEFDLKRKGGNK